jgi:predicted glycosyltransferase
VKVWIDVLTPKQANFFAELQHRLNVKGFKTILTTREYREVNELLELRNVKTIQVGRHGGGALQEKLVESSKRISELAKVVEEQDPDVAISFSSPEAARVAFGLKVPHYCVSDSPHAEAVCKLTIPISEKLFTPWIIPTYAWRRYGINPRDIIRYRALDPKVWLSGYKVNPKALDSLKLDISKPIILIRPPEELAAYLSSRSSSAYGSTVEIAAKILDLADNGLQIVVLPRYDDQADRYKKRFGNRVIATEHIVDAAALLQATSVFIGGGGTMTAEAALLGVPSISYYPGEPTFVDRFLINYGLVDRLQDPGRIAQRALAMSKNSELREFCRKKASKLLQSMEDPLRLIIQRIFK